LSKRGEDVCSIARTVPTATTDRDALAGHGEDVCSIARTVPTATTDRDALAGHGEDVYSIARTVPTATTDKDAVSDHGDHVCQGVWVGGAPHRGAAQPRVLQPVLQLERPFG